MRARGPKVDIPYPPLDEPAADHGEHAAIVEIMPDAAGEFHRACYLEPAFAAGAGEPRAPCVEFQHCARPRSSWAPRGSLGR
jgi:hypothetical protein